MKDAIVTMLVVIAFLTMPSVAIWGIGAFISWDAGWAFADAANRTGFVFLCAFFTAPFVMMAIG